MPTIIIKKNHVRLAYILILLMIAGLANLYTKYQIFKYEHPFYQGNQNIQTIYELGKNPEDTADVFVNKFWINYLAISLIFLSSVLIYKIIKKILKINRYRLIVKILNRNINQAIIDNGKSIENISKEELKELIIKTISDSCNIDKERINISEENKIEIEIEESITHD